MVTFCIYGCVHDFNTYFCESIAKKIVAALGSETASFEMKVLFEVDYWIKINDLSSRFDSNLQYYEQTHIVLRNNNEIIGDVEQFIKLAKSEYSIGDADIANSVILNRQVREGTFDKMRNNENTVVQIQFSIQDTKRPTDFEVLGSIYVELYVKLCPKACEHFLMLCEGVRLGKVRRQYVDCPVHRLVKNGWFQTGDVEDGSGRNSQAYLDDTGVVPDECFSVDFGFFKGGVLGYANEGAHTNRSQFFVTLGPCAWMNEKYVGFGRIVQGFKVLQAINKIPTTNQVPSRTIKISACGKPTEYQPQ